MTYLELVNEVLVRMREDEVTSVNDPDNDPQQKLACKYVQDAHRRVADSHTWNAHRRIWLVDLVHGVSRYVLPDTPQGSAIYSVARLKPVQQLLEVNARKFAQFQPNQGSPQYFSPMTTVDGALELQVYPTPDNTHSSTGDINTYTVARFGEAGFSSGQKALTVTGYAKPLPLKSDGDVIQMPNAPVMDYALAFAHSERGEAGGRAAVELLESARSSLGDAIAWDVNNSSAEYIWEQV